VHTATVRTFCHICEPSCGLVAHVDDGRLMTLPPDRDHPVTKGFACHKGLAAVDLHHDPDRLDHPTSRAWNVVGNLRTLPHRLRPTVTP
jgi:anaerobic selenocysteine-containing dehydrogenase